MDQELAGITLICWVASLVMIAVAGIVLTCHAIWRKRPK